MASTRERTDAHCPHCLLLVEANAPAAWPPQPVRCPHCRLLIGAGRARDAGDGAPGARGAAAGVFAREAQRGRDDAEDVSTDEVIEGIRSVAERLGSPPERLLMVDYQQEAADDDGLPDLTEVFAAFGSWKRARREAAVGQGDEAAA
ncbi:MAG TPA: hypothetical protein VGV34_01470 [Solirubrobacterales bacterium]|nr:hypothetical protein [Solirubrobacterales bacterium]